MSTARNSSIVPVLAVLPAEGPLAAAIRRLHIDLAFVTYYGFRWLTPMRYVQTLTTLVRLVRSARTEVIHLNHQWLVEYAVRAGRVTGCPVICHIRNLLCEQELSKYLPWFRRADAIVGVSQAVLAPLRAAGLAEERLHLIHNGIDFAVLNSARSGNALHGELGLPVENRLVGVIGRVVPEKGIEEFLVAAARVRQRFSDVHFVVVGADDENGGYIERLAYMADRLGLARNVTFTGFRTDIPQILHDLHLVALPSRSDMPEGLPNTVLEALAVGKLLIATRNSGVPEVIDDGVNGFLVDCDDIDALAEAMERALALSPGQQRAMSERAKLSVQNRTIENQVASLSDLYRQLLD